MIAGTFVIETTANDAASGEEDKHAAHCTEHDAANEAGPFFRAFWHRKANARSEDLL
jgi:hypothetical protein